MRKHVFWVSLGIILLVAVVLRFWRLGQVPISLYWDEVAILADARSVAATGRDMHGNPWVQAIFPSYGDYKLPVYIWLASLSVKLFGASEWAMRLPSAVAGVVTVGVATALAMQLFQKENGAQRRGAGVATAFVAALAPWSILFSRTGFEGHIGQAVLVGSVLLLFQVKKHWGWGVGAAVFGALATYTYFSIRFVWPPVFFLAMVLFFPPSKKTWLKWLLSHVLLPVAVYALLLVPMYRSPLYAASDQFRLSTVSVFTMQDWPVIANQYKLEAGNTLFDKLVFHPYVLIGRELAKNFADNLSFEFLFFTGDPNLRHGTGRHGLFLWPLLIPFVYGVYNLFTKHFRQGIFLSVWWLAALLPASVPETTPHALRSLNALVPLSIIIGHGIWQGWQTLRSKRQWRGWVGATALVTALIFFMSFSEFLSYYFRAYPQTSAAEWQDPHKQIAHAIWEKKAEANEVWVAPFDTRFYLWLLAYEVPTESFNALNFDAYIPQKIDNITFQRFKGTDSGKRVMLVDRRSNVDAYTDEHHFSSLESLSFIRADGQEEYVLTLGDTP